MMRVTLPATLLAAHNPTVAAFRARLRRLVSLIHRIIGAPDYEAYVAHATRCHPDRPLLSQNEFVTQRLTDKYSRPGSRCC